MKKQTFFQLFLAFLTLGFCQSSNGQGISIGVRGGVLINNMDINNVIIEKFTNKSVTSIQLAVPFEIAFGNMFAVQPEILYGSLGVNMTYDKSEMLNGAITTVNQSLYFKVNTLEIPVLAKVKFGSSKLKANLLVGPSLGFGMDGKAKGKSSFRGISANGTILYDDSNSHTYDAKFVKDGYNEDDLYEDEFAFSKTNLNLHFGGGVAYNLENASLFLDARYILGLSDLFPDEKDADSDEKVDGKSKRIGLSLGIMFPLNQH